MIIPLQITCRNVDLPKDVEDDIRTRAQKLETFYTPLTSCRVLVEAPARHHERGYPFHIRLDLTYPNGEIAISREQPRLFSQGEAVERRRKALETQPERKHLAVAIHDVFDVARRRLQDLARRRRVDVKTHEPMPEGRVTDLFSGKGYGYLETPDGREIYFHANSVLNQGFKQLKVGAKVRFTEEVGEKGPQASTVHPMRKALNKASVSRTRRTAKERRSA